MNSDGRHYCYQVLSYQMSFIIFVELVISFDPPITLRSGHEDPRLETKTDTGEFLGLQNQQITEKQHITFSSNKFCATPQ